LQVGREQLVDARLACRSSLRRDVSGGPIEAGRRFQQ